MSPRDQRRVDLTPDAARTSARQLAGLFTTGTRSRAGLDRTSVNATKASEERAAASARSSRRHLPNDRQVLELTGPRSQDMNGVAEEYARALNRPVTYVDVPLETWADQVLARANLGAYVDEHIATMARHHREDRYDRTTATVEEITGRPAESIEEFVARHSQLFAVGAARRTS